MTDNDILIKLHKLEMKIALEFKRVCDKNNLDYYMIAGTLLGAVRHKGFIPWDDDMDFGMKREHYEKFIECCKTDLNDEFFLQTWDTDPEYPFSYAKLRLKNTEFNEEFSKHSKMMKGIFIDIFPYDNVPTKLKQLKEHKKKYFLYKRILWIKKGCGGVLKEKNLIKFILFNSYAMLFSYDKVRNNFTKLQTKYNREFANKLVTDGSYGYDKESINSDYFNEKTTLTFEGEEFTTFKEYKKYLITFYGDYMKLPPESERVGHLPNKIDFGKY